MSVRGKRKTRFLAMRPPEASCVGTGAAGLIRPEEETGFFCIELKIRVTFEKCFYLQAGLLGTQCANRINKPPSGAKPLGSAVQKPGLQFHKFHDLCF
jgi:hypothetical protein